MNEIPDTGPGLSGFLGYLLWLVYQYFPSHDQSDWLLLLFFLACATHFVFLPYLWKCVQADMATLRDGRQAQKHQGYLGLWGAGWLFFFAWFFSTAAGQTFTRDRQLNEIPIRETAAGVSVVSFALSLAALGLFAFLDHLTVRRHRAAAATLSRPHPDRGFLSLYGGGGIFLTKDGIDETGTVVLIEIIIVVFAQLFYWKWSVTSLALMQCFLLSAVVADGIRMWFVAILHRRTFSETGTGR